MFLKSWTTIFLRVGIEALLLMIANIIFFR